MNTNNIGLIIQGTLSGLGNMLVSPNLATTLENSSIKASLVDERNEIAQFIRNTVVYSVENNAQLQIFSIILTDKLDSFKRAGYVAIRLYFPKGTTSQQPIAMILNQLKDKFEEVTKTNSGSIEIYASQFYQITNAIQIIKEPETCTLGIHKKVFMSFDSQTEDISQKIQHNSAKSYFNKIYVIPSNYEVNLLQNGFIDTSKIAFKTIALNGAFHVVERISVNNHPIVFGAHNSSLSLSVLPSDQIVIDYRDGRKENVSLMASNHMITQKQYVPKSDSHYSSKGKPKSKPTGNLVLVLGVIGVVTIASFFLWPKDNVKVNYNANTETNTVTPVTTNKDTLDGTAQQQGINYKVVEINKKKFVYCIPDMGEDTAKVLAIFGIFGSTNKLAWCKEIIKNVEPTFQDEELTEKEIAKHNLTRATLEKKLVVEEKSTKKEEVKKGRTVKGKGKGAGNGVDETQINLGTSVNSNSKL
jgi:hypothetical protein